MFTKKELIHGAIALLVLIGLVALIWFTGRGALDSQKPAVKDNSILIAEFSGATGSLVGETDDYTGFVVTDDVKANIESVLITACLSPSEMFHPKSFASKMYNARLFVHAPNQGEAVDRAVMPSEDCVILNTASRAFITQVAYNGSYDGSLVLQASFYGTAIIDPAFDGSAIHGGLNGLEFWIDDFVVVYI